MERVIKPHRLDHAKEWALSAHKRYNLTPPVDLHKVRKGLKLFVRREAMVRDSGYLLKTAHRWYVVINSNHNHERSRFTLAHEICELLLKQYAERNGRLFIKDDAQRERFCDRFAAHLLMPEDHVREQARLHYHSRTNDKTASLASKFEVSEAAMRNRLRELGLLGTPRGIM